MDLVSAGLVSVESQNGCQLYKYFKLINNRLSHVFKVVEVFSVSFNISLNIIRRIFYD